MSSPFLSLISNYYICLHTYIFFYQNVQECVRSSVWNNVLSGPTAAGFIVSHGPNKSSKQYLQYNLVLKVLTNLSHNDNGLKTIISTDDGKNT